MTQKTQQGNLKRTDAILEVFLDRCVEQNCNGSEDLALICFLEQDLTEFSVSVRIKNLPVIGVLYSIYIKYMMYRHGGKIQECL